MPKLPDAMVAGPRGPALVDALEQGSFRHLEREVNVGYDEPNWYLGPQDRHRLWIITLHYHGWADALAEEVARGDLASDRAAHLFRHYVDDWIQSCRLTTPGARTLAWNSYAIATRIGFWVRAVQRAGFALLGAVPGFRDRFLASLWQQAAYLSDHLEWDLRANHLTRDLTGLAVAGRFFADDEARRWLVLAEDLAPTQAAEQMLPDGGHFERSPKYHVDVMDDLLTLALLIRGEEPRTTLTAAWRSAANWLAWMRHPDGDVPLLNDGGRVGAGELAAVLARGRCLGASIDQSPRLGGRLFADSGVAVWHGHPWSAFIDVGPPGPDVQPGHGHADNLSLECSYRGQRLVVDPGNYGYDDDARRRYDRSTEAHNTVCVDTVDSSEVWEVFRLGRRAAPLGVKAKINADGLTVDAGHDGYDHLPGRPRHRRRVELANGGALMLTDTVRGSREHGLSGGLLLAPGWRAEVTSGGWSVERCGARIRIVLQGPPELEPFCEQRPYHPSYGVEELGTRLGWRWRGRLPFELRTILEPY